MSIATSALAPPSSAPSQGTVSGFPKHAPPGSASANTSRQSSLANLVHDMDIGSGPGHESGPAVIDVDGDEEADDEDEEGEGVEEEHYAGEGGEDDDENSEDSEDDDEAFEDDTDVPTVTPTVSTSRHGCESSKPNNRGSPTPPSGMPATLGSAPPVMRRSISVTELTDTMVSMVLYLRTIQRRAAPSPEPS